MSARLGSPAYQSEASTRDTGTYVRHFYMGDEPPQEQYMLDGDTWVPLDDGWYLMDLVIDGTPDLTGPVKNPPKGVPPIKVS